MISSIPPSGSNNKRPVLEFLAALQYVCTFLFMGLTFLALLIYLLLFTRFWWVAVVYGVFYCVDRNTPIRGGRRLNWTRNWPIFKMMARYFPAKLHKTAALDAEKNYLLCCHPHGVLCTGAFLSFATEGTGFSRLFPGITSYLCALDGHFIFPVYRDYFMSGGGISASQRSIEYVLGGRRGRGNLLCLLPGGAREALDSHPGKYAFHLKSKFGFIKVAMRTGASLIPCISFGETRLYEQMANAEGTLVRKIQNFLVPIIGISLPIFHGIGLAPYRQPINTVVGEPIEMKKTLDPTYEEVAEAKAIYVNKLRELFDKYKPLYDPEGEDMVIC